MMVSPTNNSHDRTNSLIQNPAPTQHSIINYVIYECVIPTIKLIGKILFHIADFAVKFAIAGKVFYLHPHAFSYTAVGCFAFTPLRNLARDALYSIDIFLNEFIFSLNLHPFRLFVMGLTIFLCVQNVFDFMTMATFIIAAKVGVSLYDKISSKLIEKSVDKQSINDSEFKKTRLEILTSLRDSLETLIKLLTPDDLENN